ncbi:MAG: hypothetical protein DM484_24425 [Candidatus Methylumidiphilus alinenensis]|uniref:Solute-binding protein family 5 domain-containing protein n=1 Tax=Candidatus Methylumidiphilus alinenensis TaxID=2202197 RepID=A0A2W4QJX6_9GAMM|nr:MAG: hypothetical protein DM484_24425 [Candidatus Methylumidiphilus alinenensis]
MKVNIIKKWVLILLGMVLLGAGGYAVYCGWKAEQKTPVIISESAKQERPFVIAFENEVVSLDPIRLTDVFGLRIASQIFEGLAKVDASNRIVPALGESWQADRDFKNWTFKLRKEAHFHNGKPVTADDVVFSFTRMLAKEAVTKGPLIEIIVGAKEYAEGQATSISGITIIEPDHVKFQLTRSDSGFLGRIASPAYSIVSKEEVEQSKDQFGNTLASGTGPFRLQSRNNYELTLERFADYWGGKGGNLNLVKFRTIKEDQVRLNELRGQRIQAMYVTPPLIKALIEATSTNDQPHLKPEFSQFKGITYPVFNTYFLAFNYPKVNAHLRRAIALAVDREQIVQGVAPQLAVAAAGPIPLSCDGWQTQVQANPPDIAAVRKELSKIAPKKPSFKPTVEVLVHDLAQAEPIGEIIKAQLEPLGVQVNLVRQSFNTVIERLTKGDYQAVVIAFEYQFPTPSLILENFYTSRAIPMPNLFHYSNPAVDKSVGNLFSKPESAKTLRDAEAIEKRIVEDAPAAFLFQMRQMVVLTSGVDGILFNGANFPILWGASWK